MNRFTKPNYEHDLFRAIYCKLQDLENIEEENKALKESKEIRFVFGTCYKLSKPFTCKVKIDDGKVVVEEGK